MCTEPVSRATDSNRPDQCSNKLYSCGFCIRSSFDNQASFMLPHPHSVGARSCACTFQYSALVGGTSMSPSAGVPFARISQFLGHCAELRRVAPPPLATPLEVAPAAAASGSQNRAWTPGTPKNRSVFSNGEQSTNLGRTKFRNEVKQIKFPTLPHRLSNV